MKEWRILFYLSAGFALIFLFPLSAVPFSGPVFEAVALVQWYAREHVLLCLVPAFFIAGAISVFLSQQSVIRYFGPEANKFLSYGVASVSGTILAVCSCTILPIFAGIYKRGAGIGPASAFLYSGPAINILAIILTARVLGWRLGLARALGAILFSIVIGWLMHLIFLKEEKQRPAPPPLAEVEAGTERSLLKSTVFFGILVSILIFANWGQPPAGSRGIWSLLYEVKWHVTILMAVALAAVLMRWFRQEELSEWLAASWGFAKQILPLLFLGVLAAGLLLGRPGHEGLIPAGAVEGLVGGNSPASNFFAAVAGAFMYFATLTEVPILEGLIGAGMGKGPALALLLAGPALSLPNMLVIRSVIGTKKTAVFVLLVVVMASISGIIYGSI